jgi:hypothetical protein
LVDRAAAASRPILSGRCAGRGTARGGSVFLLLAISQTRIWINNSVRDAFDDAGFVRRILILSSSCIQPIAECRSTLPRRMLIHCVLSVWLFRNASSCSIHASRVLSASLNSA